MQVIFSGDVFQLDPVENEYDPEKYIIESKYCFPHWILLTEIVSQDEKDFIEFLSRLAKGTCTEEDTGYVKQNFSKTLDPKDFGMDYIPKIFCTNYQIFIETLEQLEDVPGELYTFESTDDGNKKVLKRCIADHNLHVKIGISVILLYNIDNKLVNGSCGKVVAIDNGVPVINFKEAGRVQKIDKKSWSFCYATDSSKLVAKRTQFPLKPCWGITSHKSQGQSLKAAIVISGNEFCIKSALRCVQQSLYQIWVMLERL